MCYECTRTFASITCSVFISVRAKLACVRHLLSYSRALFEFCSESSTALKSLPFSPSLIQLLMQINVWPGALHRYINYSLLRERILNIYNYIIIVRDR